jgi:hypothetical protein
LRELYQRALTSDVLAAENPVPLGFEFCLDRRFGNTIPAEPE